MQGSKQKDWAEALRRAVHRESAGKGSPKWLDVIANKVCEAASEGDPQAFKEIGDRLDGKPKQQSEVSGPNGSPIAVRNATDMTDEELAVIAAAGSN